MSQMTVVVVSHNRREALLRTLPEHQAPVILVDNASDDGTADAVEVRLPRVRVVRLPVNAGAAGRNVGARLLTAWLRRPMRDALRLTGRAAADPAQRPGLLAALPDPPDPRPAS